MDADTDHCIIENESSPIQKAYHSNGSNNNYTKELQGIRKAVESHGISAEGIDDPTLLRFLKARSMRAEKAAKMFVQHQKWRASFVPLGYIRESEVENELASGKIFLQGASKKGWPLVIAFASKHHPNKDNFEEFKRFVVHLLDKTIASSGSTRSKDQKIMVVLDLNDLGFKNIDIRAMVTGFQLLQNYYPERLARLYMVNAPKIFFSAWKIVSRCLDMATKDKIVFLQSHEISKSLLEEVDVEILPSKYGGQANLILLQDVHLHIGLQKKATNCDSACEEMCKSAQTNRCNK